MKTSLYYQGEGRTFGATPRQRTSVIPTRAHERKSTAEQSWPCPFSAEPDTVSQVQLRRLVREVIDHHLPAYEPEVFSQPETLNKISCWRTAGMVPWGVSKMLNYGNVFRSCRTGI